MIFFRCYERLTGLSQEAVVMALLELGVDVLHGLESHAHQDDDRGTAEAAPHDTHLGEHDNWDHGNNREVGSTHPREAAGHILEVFGRWTPCADTRNEAAVALHIVRNFLRVERDGGVEEG